MTVSLFLIHVCIYNNYVLFIYGYKFGVPYINIYIFIINVYVN